MKISNNDPLNKTSNLFVEITFGVKNLNIILFMKYCKYTFEKHKIKKIPL